MTSLTHAANDAYLLNPSNPRSGIYVPVVKLVRQIRRALAIDEPKGFYFEVLTYHAFKALDPSERTVAEYLAVVLSEIADRLPEYTETGPADPTLPGCTISTRATGAQVEAAGGALPGCWRIRGGSAGGRHLPQRGAVAAAAR